MSTREAAVKTIEQLAPPPLAVRMVESLRPSLRITTQPSVVDILLGQSRLGGWPDVPPDFVWPTAGEPFYSPPRPLTLVAQVNLAELPADLDAELPSRGQLLFFLDLEEGGYFEFSGGVEPHNRWRVVYVDRPGDELAEMPRPGDDPDSRPAVRALGFAPEWTVDDDLRYSADERDCVAFDAVREALIGRGSSQHRLLGHAQPIQGRLEENVEATFRQAGVQDTPPTEDQIAAIRSRWRSLLQIDSDDDLGWTWGDFGRAHFMIRHADLARRDFASVMFELQCH